LAADYGAKATRFSSTQFSMHAPNSAPPAPVVEAPAPPSREGHGARRTSEGRLPQAPGSWLNTNGSKLGLGLAALVALSLIPFASLTIQAFAMIVAFMALIMTKRMSVLTALIIFALLGGFGPRDGPMMLNGVKAIAA
jgi:hypothetical protein